jgi:polyhydroxybutyrate depolymerase
MQINNSFLKDFFMSGLHLLLYLFGLTMFFGSCTAPPPEIPPGPKDIQIAHDNYIREVTFHIPRKLRKRKRSLVLCLHPADESPESFARITRRGFNRLSETNNFILGYPEALNKYWNDARVDSISLSHYDEVDDVGFLEKVIDYAIDSFRIDPEQVFVLGLSEGGLMTYRLACEIPEKIKGFAAVAASMSLDQLVECRADTTISLLAINGTRDPVLPYDGGQIMIEGVEMGSVLPIEDALAFWVKENGCEEKFSTKDMANRDTFDETRSEKYTYDNCKDNRSIVLIKVNNGGHTWPGGRQYEGQKNIGKTSRDFDAAVEIWKFFKGL